MKKLLAIFLLVVILFDFGVGEVLATTRNPVWVQLHFRFRDDNGTETGATWLQTEDTNVTNMGKGTPFRLRIATQESNNQTVGSTVIPQLQFKLAAGGACTDTTGWTNVASGTAIGLTSSTFVTDKQATTNQLTLPTGGYTFIAGEVLTSSNPADGVAPAKQMTEHEWNLILNSGAADNTAYILRQANNGTNYNTYTVCPQLTTAAAASPTYTQNHYRWYVDPDTENVTDPWSSVSGVDIAEDTGITVTPFSNDPPDTTQELRLRVNLTVATANLSASAERFKLQYRRGSDSDCSATGEGWTDVNTGNAWTYATSTVTDGATLTVSKLTGTNVLENYIKARPSALNTNSATTTQNIEYDYHIIGGGAISATRYLFRVVKTDVAGTGTTALTAYTNCAILVTEPGTADEMRHGQTLNEFAGKNGFFWAD